MIGWLLSAVAAEVIGYLLPEAPTVVSAASTQSLMDRSLLSSRRTKLLSEYMPICERNIFDSEKRSPCTEEIAPLEDTKEIAPSSDAKPVKTDMAIQLLGTMVSSNPRKSFATISPKTGKESQTTT